MTVGSIVFMLLGLAMTWGGLAYSLMVQIKNNQSPRS